MSVPSADILKELEVLNKKYSIPAKQFTQEERAALQTIEKLLQSVSTNKRLMLSEISITSIENITKHGQLTLIAEKLDDNFLQNVEKFLQTTDIVFKSDQVTNDPFIRTITPVISSTSPGRVEEISLSKLYEEEKEKLEIKMQQKPNFSDILLKMYTEETAFYKKINAILGGYNNPKTTTPEEKKISLLLNIAIHKAGLNKQKLEMHKLPDVLYRGQSFGDTVFEEKFKKVEAWFKEGKLDSLTPQEIAEVNIIDIAAKKIVSTTSNLNTAKRFAKKGIILEIENPQKLADFYNVANISDVHEEEYISRLPDDIVMIPISIKDDGAGIKHIKVMCIQSEEVLSLNSSRLNELRDALKQGINQAIETNNYLISHYLKKGNDVVKNAKKVIMKHLVIKQNNILNKLIGLVNKSETKQNDDPLIQQKFIENSILTLMQLYRIEHTEEQHSTFNNINTMLQDYAAVVGNLSVVHRNHDLNETLMLEKQKLNTNLEGKRVWLKSVLREKSIQPIQQDLIILLDRSASLLTIKATAQNILMIMENEIGIRDNYPLLQESLNDIISSIDEIERKQSLLESSQVIPPMNTRYSSISPSTMKTQLQDMKQENLKEEISARNHPRER